MLKFKEILSQHNERFLVDNITSLLAVIDKDFTVLNANESFKSTFFKTDEEVINQKFADILKCSYQEDQGKECMISDFCGFCNLKTDIENSISEGSPKYNQLFSNVLNIDDEKREKHFQYTVKPINYDGQSLCLLIMDDVSESFLKSQQLQEALTKKNELIGIAAHDIRTPLSSIKNTLSLLLSNDTKKEDDDYKMSIEHVLETVNYSLRLVDDILDSSALDAGELNLIQKKQNYKEFVIEVLKGKKFIAKQKSIEISWDIQTDAEIYFDRIKIHQVFDNLIQNAIEYSPVNSDIKVKVYEDDSNIITEVHDKGIGISEENRNIIFNKYLMEKKNYNKNPEERSGLGLAIAKLIIRKHRGNIEVESELGKGSVFIFSLPSI